ncbi:helix-turn-helix domain-containing protein [Wenzhouxiangella sediminis]|uniref:Helix-turn-helix domain-containing protein n=1 Tax=Wenzhouxiangella sediminis TaxID=1792836 RepID=A0A3E1KBX8_9GAMM|nr:helix-turn-helix domain-containing protein [Wenzhouxiangella sediminis]RFF32220.1 helix-turn-helix domain-containing protein [Wenzhouxiangella sediminis]
MTENTSASTEATQQDSKERYERIGAQLKRRREALSLDQGDVAQQLHLPGMVVNDIETGQVDKLSSLYRRGYIRNYARLLDLDPDDVLAEAGEDQLPELQEVLPASRREWRLERYLKISTYAIVTVAVVVPLVYAFLAGGSRMLDRDAGSPETSLAQTDEAAGRSSKASTDGAPAEGPDSSSVRHVSASALPLNPMRPSREATAEADPDMNEASGPSEDTAVEEAGPRPSALQLELLEDSWIEILDAAGTRLEYDLLRAGQTRNYEGQAPFSLLVGRSSAVRLQVNGREVTWEGHESGDVAEIAVAADGQVTR